MKNLILPMNKTRLKRLPELILLMRSRKKRPSRDSGNFAGGDVPAQARGHDRKTLQLCRQVADTLGLVLSGECDDDILRSLRVVAVVPAPDASQLLVIVAPALADEALEPADVLNRLASCTGRLRCEVAAAISRRRTPRLAFQFVSSPSPIS
jgi:ribosome-binding factor A